MRPSSPIVSTLISAPAPDRRLIERDSLRDRLDIVTARRLVHISAPAGYGKTSLLAAWFASLRSTKRPASWISLSEEHQSASTLLRYIVGALRQSWPNVGEATLTLLGSGFSVGSATIVATLVNELAAVSVDTVLVLDDVHYLAKDDAVSTLHEFISLAPPTLHFVTASRESLPFPVGRLRERGELEEITTQELEFSDSEVQCFLDREGIQLEPNERRALTRNTGGWAAGLRLSSIALKQETERSSFIESFSGGHRVIGEFLQEDVLSRQPEALQEFLVNVGLLREVSAAQCDYILERDDSIDMLELAQTKGLFLFNVDFERQRFRFHHLFAEFLTSRLARENPPGKYRIHTRASEWYAEHGDSKRAIEHSLIIENYQRAGDLLETFSELLFAQGQLDSLNEFASRLPDTLRRCCPRLQLDLVWIHTLNWEVRRAQNRIAEVREYVTETYGDNVPTRLAEKILHREIMIALLQDRLDESEALWTQWPSVTTGENEYFEGSAESASIIAHRERLDIRFVLSAAPRVRRLYDNAGTAFGTVWFDSIVGPTHLLAGEPEDAVAILSGAMATASRISGDHSPLVAMPALLLVATELDLYRLDSARLLLDKWLPLSDRIGFVDQLIAGYISAARLAEIDGNDDAVFDYLADGDRLAAAYEFDRLAAHLDCERSRQLLRIGLVDDARELLSYSPALKERRFLPPTSGANRTDAAAALARARAAPEQAGIEVERVLRTWVGFFEGRGCVSEAMRFRGALAVTQLKNARVREAWRTLRKGLGLMASTGLVWPLIENGPALLTILDSSEQSGGLDGDLLLEQAHHLRTIFKGDSVPPESVGRSLVPQTTNPVNLTPRQREILSAVADGSSNKEVASRLGLSDTTVKWHLRHAYEALGVHRRVAAVRRARALGLIV